MTIYLSLLYNDLHQILVKVHDNNVNRCMGDLVNLLRFLLSQNHKLLIYHCRPINYEVLCPYGKCLKNGYREVLEMPDRNRV